MTQVLEFLPPSFDILSLNYLKMEKIFLIFLFVVCVSARGRSMPGGWSDVKDVNSPSIQGVAKNATRILASKMNSDYHLKMMEITSARKQVCGIAGFLKALNIPLCDLFFLIIINIKMFYYL